MKKSKMSAIPFVLSFILIAFGILYLSRYKAWENAPFENISIEDYGFTEVSGQDGGELNSQYIDDDTAKSLFEKYDFSIVQNYYGN